MAKLTFLLDSNVLIALDPAIGAVGETRTVSAAEFQRLATTGGHELYRHLATDYDFARDKDAQRAQLRGTVLQKYTLLEHAPGVPAHMQQVVGEPNYGTNDWVDDQLLAAVYKDAVDHLVTDDDRIHRKARRLGIDDRVLTVSDVVGFLRKLFEHVPEPPPIVQALPAYALRDNDPIFNTLRQDYAPDFDNWFARVRRQHRKTLVIEGENDYAAICILKTETDRPFGLDGRVLKICTFKVADGYAGRGYAELLLKAIFDRCHQMGFDRSYVSIFDRHEGLITFFDQFGFAAHDDRTDLGEAIYCKEFESAGIAIDLDPLSHHVRYGPPALRLDRDTPMYIVPIRPIYHTLLFPEAPGQQLLRPDQPYGNAIRKAYLCHAPVKTLEPGSVLLFYTSGVQTAQCIGVTETVRRSSVPQEIASFVGNRTVYTYDEIEDMCEEREVIAIRFRRDRLLPSPLRVPTLRPLKSSFALRSPSCMFARKERNGFVNGSERSLVVDPSHLRGRDPQWHQARGVQEVAVLS